MATDPLALAVRGTQMWHAVVNAQRTATPHHSEFYTCGVEVGETLQALVNLTSVLADQVRGYGETRILSDDDAGQDPYVRIALAASVLDQLTQHLAGAEISVTNFCSAIRHIAVEAKT